MPGDDGGVAVAERALDDEGCGPVAVMARPAKEDCEETAAENHVVAAKTIVKVPAVPVPAEAQTEELAVSLDYPESFAKIYALETVDISSVRRVAAVTPMLPKSAAPTHAPLQVLESETEPELDLGLTEQEWIPSLRLNEPIQVLCLSAAAQKALLQNGKTALRDLIDLDTRDFLFLKGLGQGHIDEVRQRLATYLKGCELYRCRTVNFGSLLRGLFCSVEPKLLFCLLDPFGLSYLFPLASADQAAVRYLTKEKRHEWSALAQSMLLTPEKKESLQKQLQQIARAFFQPWMRRRQGLATQQELLDRLLAVSENTEESEAVLRLLNKFYGSGTFLPAADLPRVGRDLYCVDGDAASRYKTIVIKAQSYFYTFGITYPFSELISLLNREFGVAWVGFPEGCVEKTLRLSPLFRVRKGRRALAIKLS